MQRNREILSQWTRWLAVLGLSSIFTVVASSEAVAKSSAETVREEKTVIVDGSREVWRLVWEDRPSAFCGAADAPSALTCPCSGFAYGEQGKLALVRAKGDGTEERLELGSAFNPKTFFEGGLESGHAALSRWPVLDSDLGHQDDGTLATAVPKRPLTDVMQLADYDHDGQATQFLLQVDSQPSGKREMVLVGVSRQQPHLHIFSSVEEPQKPLVLGVWVWEALRRSSGETDAIEWMCGDHLSEVEKRVYLRVRNGKISAQRQSRQCPDQG